MRGQRGANRLDFLNRWSHVRIMPGALEKKRRARSLGEEWAFGARGTRAGSVAREIDVHLNLLTLFFSRTQAHVSAVRNLAAACLTCASTETHLDHFRRFI